MTARPTAPPSHQTAAGQSLGAMPCSSSWIEVDDANPASVPETFGHFLVATDSGLVTESFYVPDLRHFAGRPIPSRKWNGKYSRRFEVAQRGYKITHWMPLPAHPKTNNQQQ